MNNRFVQVIVVLVACGAVAFAIYSFMTNQGTTVTSSPTPTASLAPSATPTPDTSPIPSPSVDPSRTFTDKQGLSVANTIDTLTQGSSLFTISQKHDMSVEALSKLNSIDNVNSVFAGQTLIIPDDLTTDTYTVLFVTNTKRMEKETKALAAGGSSLYSDPITAAQTDVKGIYKLSADTPYSKSSEAGTRAVVTTSDTEKVVTVTLDKDTTSNLWLVRKVTIKITKTATPTPSI